MTQEHLDCPEGDSLPRDRNSGERMPEVGPAGVENLHGSYGWLKPSPPVVRVRQPSTRVSSWLDR